MSFTGWLPTIAGAILLLAGLVCLILEVKVVSHGILTFVGLVLCIVGLYLLLGRIPWIFVIPAALAVATMSVALTVMAVRARAGKPLGDTRELVGRVVPVSQAVGPDGGKVVVDGVFWNAVSPRPIAAGSKVRIVGANGLVLTVEEPKEEPA